MSSWYWWRRCNASITNYPYYSIILLKDLAAITIEDADKKSIKDIADYINDRAGSIKNSKGGIYELIIISHLVTLI